MVKNAPKQLDNENSLNEKQKQFCNEYIIDFNGTQAAIRAGYSKKTANEQAAQLLAKLSIQNFVKELIENRSQRTQITQDEVVNKIVDVVNICTQKIEQTTDNGDIIEKMVDVNGANKALDMLMKHTGAYKADNSQKQPSVTTHFNGFQSMEELIENFQKGIGRK